MAILYADRSDEVHLGDRVSTRIWFKRYTGRIGVSNFNADFQRDGLSWIAIRLDDGGLVQCIVDPESQTLLEKIELLERDPSPVTQLEPRPNELEDGGFTL